jgi:hypothetical protein
MDEQSIVLDLRSRSWTTRVIHDILVTTTGGEAIACSTVTKYFDEAQINSDHGTQ